MHNFEGPPEIDATDFAAEVHCRGMPTWRTNVPSLAVTTVRMVSTATRTVCEPLVRAKTRECTERGRAAARAA